MNNKELNLCEILKNCPEGTKLYSPILGEVTFISVLNSEEKILVRKCGDTCVFRKDGKGITECPEYPITEEVMLFPSRENRDWSTFTPKKERFDPNTLKPFDRVLAKIGNGKWCAMLFSHLVDDRIVCEGWEFKKCIPYNDDTKHLVGTTDAAPEYYRYWEED